MEQHTSGPDSQRKKERKKKKSKLQGQAHLYTVLVVVLFQNLSLSNPLDGSPTTSVDIFTRKRSVDRASDGCEDGRDKLPKQDGIKADGRIRTWDLDIQFPVFESI